MVPNLKDSAVQTSSGASDGAQLRTNSLMSDLDDTIDKLSWWKTQEHSLPTWCAEVKKILIVQPSSAAVEHVFRYSILDLVTNKNTPFRITLKFL